MVIVLDSDVNIGFQRDRSRTLRIDIILVNWTEHIYSRGSQL